MGLARRTIGALAVATAATVGVMAFGAEAASASPPTSDECSGLAAHSHATVRSGAPGPRPSDTAAYFGWLFVTRSVGHAQHLLVARFDQRIGVDCQFGKETEKAVRNVQLFCRQATGRDIAVDGTVGPVTWRILDSGDCRA